MLPSKDTKPLLLKLVVEAIPGPARPLAPGTISEEFYETIVDIPNGWYVTGVTVMVPDYSTPQSRWLKILHFPFTLDGDFYVRTAPHEDETTCRRFHLDETSPRRFISRGLAFSRKCYSRGLAMVRHE